MTPSISLIFFAKKTAHPFAVNLRSSSTMNVVGTSFFYFLFFFQSHAPIGLLLTIFLSGQFFFQYYGNNVATLPQFFPKLCLDFIIIIIIILIARRPAAVELLPFEVVCRLVVVSSNIRAQLCLCSLIVVRCANKIHQFQCFIVNSVLFVLLFSNMSTRKKNSIILINTERVL